MKKQPRVPKHSHTDQNEASINPEATELYDAAQITTGTFDGDRLPAMSTTKKGAVPATGAPANHYLRDDGTFAHPAQNEINGLETTATPRFAGLGIGVAGESNALAIAEGFRIGPAAGLRQMYNLSAALLQLLGGDLDIGDTPTRPGTGGTWSTSYDSTSGKIHCFAEFMGKLYAGSDDGFVYVYDGSSWAEAFDASPATKITALCVFGNNLYACGWRNSSGVSTYVYSTDDGTNWSTVWDHNWGYIVEGILSMAVHDWTLYVGLTQSGVYASTEGLAFSSTSFPAGYGVAGLCVFAGSLYAAANNIVSGASKIYKLSGGAWSAVYTDGASINFNCIYTWNGKLYAGATAGHIYASANGTDWAEVEDLGSMSVQCLYEFAGLLLAGCDNGTIYQSADGLTWSSFVATGEAEILAILEYGGDLFAGTGTAGKVRVYIDATYVAAPNLQVFGHLRLWGQFRPGDAAGVEGDILLSGGAAHPSWLGRGDTGQYVGGVTGGKPIFKDIPASDVVVTPVGGIAAEDVQAALAELDGEKGPVPIAKADTGDPASGIEGQVCVNTYDKTVKIYAGGAWRTVATWT